MYIFRWFISINYFILKMTVSRSIIRLIEAHCYFFFEALELWVTQTSAHYPVRYEMLVSYFHNPVYSRPVCVNVTLKFSPLQFRLLIKKLASPCTVLDSCYYITIRKSLHSPTLTDYNYTIVCTKLHHSV
jgi:hypothetical protein